jgi:hypothetical protein
MNLSLLKRELEGAVTKGRKIVGSQFSRANGSVRYYSLPGNITTLLSFIQTNRIQLLFSW